MTLTLLCRSSFSLLFTFPSTLSRRFPVQQALRQQRRARPERRSDRGILPERFRGVSGGPDVAWTSYGRWKLYQAVHIADRRSLGVVELGQCGALPAHAVGLRSRSGVWENFPSGPSFYLLHIDTGRRCRRFFTLDAPAPNSTDVPSFIADRSFCFTPLCSSRL
jgi:hypothetical protein